MNACLPVAISGHTILHIVWRRGVRYGVCLVYNFSAFTQKILEFMLVRSMQMSVSPTEFVQIPYTFM